MTLNKRTGICIFSFLIIFLCSLYSPVSHDEISSYTYDTFPSDYLNGDLEELWNEQATSMSLDASELIVFGTSRYSDGADTQGAFVSIISSVGETNQPIDNKEGYWEFDCGISGLNWPIGTNFTVVVSGCCGHTGWSGHIVGSISDRNQDMGNIITYPNKNPDTPSILSGFQYIQVHDPGIITVIGSDPNPLHQIKFRFDWDVSSHDYSNYSHYVDSNVVVNRSHIWDSPGTYLVKAQSKDTYGRDSEWSEPITIVVYENDDPPDIPLLSGPMYGKKNETYTFNITTTDPDGDNVYYLMDWDDTSPYEWVGPYHQGEMITIHHIWNKTGTYSVKVKARDTYHVESIWSQPVAITISEPIIDIGNITGGFMTIDLEIMNNGDYKADDIKWNITVDGGVIVTNRLSHGSIETILPGERVIVTSSLLVGIGEIKIKAQIDSPDQILKTKQEDGTMYLFYCSI